MGVNTKRFDNASDMITFSRASGAYGLTKVSYGPELAPSFDIETNWTTVTGWTWAAGVWSYADTGLDYISASNTPIVAGKTYVATITFASAPAASGYIFALFNSSANENYLGSYADFTGSGTIYTKVFTASSSSAGVRFYGNAGGAAFSVSEISIKEVTYNSSDPSATLKLIYHPNDVPRIEYNVDGSAKGLLVEGARTNLIKQSAAMSISPWSGQGNLNSTGFLAPDGSSAAIKLYEDTSTGPHQQFQANIPTTAGTYTGSVYAKAAEYNNFQMLFSGFGFGLLYVNFQLTGEGSVTASAGNDSAAIESVGDGWYRCSFTATTATSNNEYLQCLLTDGNSTAARNPSYLGDGASGIYLWGAQMEAGSFPTSYIETENTTATRALDLAEINVSNFINKSAGTFLATFNYSDPTNADNNYVFSGSSNARVFYNNAGNSVWQTYDGSAGTTFGAVDSGEVYKLAVAVKTDSNISTAKNGTIQTTRTVNTALMTSIEAYPLLAIGGASSSSSYQKLNGHIKSVTYYPRRLTDAQIQRLTQPISTPTLSLTFDGQATSFTEDSIHG